MTLTTQAGVPARPMRRDAARNRQLLIEAAREVFAQRGFEASLDDVARHAGLGVGTAYRHFANKQELATALIEQAVDQIFEVGERALAVPDGWASIVTFLEGALEVQSMDRGLREVLMGLHDPAQFDQIHDRLSGVVLDLLRRAQAQGAVRADLEESDIGFIIMMVCSVAEVSGDVAPQIWRRYLGICLEGLKPEAPALPVAALDDVEFRQAMANHKARLKR